MLNLRAAYWLTLLFTPEIEADFRKQRYRSSNCSFLLTWVLQRSRICTFLIRACRHSFGVRFCVNKYTERWHSDQAEGEPVAYLKIISSCKRWPSYPNKIVSRLTSLLVRDLIVSFAEHERRFGPSRMITVPNLSLWSWKKCCGITCAQIDTIVPLTHVVINYSNLITRDLFLHWSDDDIWSAHRCSSPVLCSCQLSFNIIVFLKYGMFLSGNLVKILRAVAAQLRHWSCSPVLGLASAIGLSSATFFHFVGSSERIRKG